MERVHRPSHRLHQGPHDLVATHVRLESVDPVIDTAEVEHRVLGEGIEATRRRLRAAASAEFAEHGVDGTTVTRIAGRAGIDSIPNWPACSSGKASEALRR
jgi:Bacterial regulatory proteins, tetR family